MSTLSVLAWVRAFAARHPVASRWVRRLWQPVLIVLLVAAYLPGQFLGERPASWDHVVHFNKAANLLHRLPTLDLWSWDWSMYAGYPTEYGYPVTAELLVVFVWGLALGTISLSHAYALTIFAVYAFSAGTVYFTFSRWIGRPAAAMTAFFCITDFGDFFARGWFFTVLFGVWPAFLSIALGLIFLERCVALLRDGAAESEGVFRVGHSLVEDHDLVELGTLTRVPLLKFSFTPTINYLSNMLPVTEDVANLVGLRYLVVPEPIADPNFVLRERQDPYLIYENQAWNPSPVRVLRGEGASAGLRWNRAGSDSTPGHYELTFERRPSERAAFVVSIAAWLALAVWGLARRKRTV